MFRKKDFVYDAYFDCYLCPNNQPLLFSTITRDGYRTYKSNPKFCRSCPLLKNCTLSTKHQKIVTRHVWVDLMDELEHQRHTAYDREKYKKETIERVFADAKEKHGCATPSIEAWKKSGTCDACFCRNESEKIGYLAVVAYVFISFIIQK